MSGSENGSSGRFVVATTIAIAISAPAMFALLLPFGGPRDALRLVGSLPLQIAAGYAAMLLVVLLFAPRLGPLCERTPLWMTPLHLLLFVVGVLAGCTVNWLHCDIDDPWSYFAKPAIPMLVVGCVPALLIGQIGAMVLVALQSKRR